MSNFRLTVAFAVWRTRGKEVYQLSNESLSQTHSFIYDQLTISRFNDQSNKESSSPNTSLSISLILFLFQFVLFFTFSTFFQFLHLGSLCDFFHYETHSYVPNLFIILTFGDLIETFDKRWSTKDCWCQFQFGNVLSYLWFYRSRPFQLLMSSSWRSDDL